MAAVLLEPEKSLFVMVGDPSGDRHASKLLRRFAAERPDVKIWGVGGPSMIANGVECLHNCQDFAVLGIAEVLKQIPFFARLRSQLLGAIDKRKPSAVLLVDCGGFNLNLAAGIRKRHPDLPILYFISPQVWGSRPWRMNVIAKTVTKMLVIFPFEEQVYKARNIEARFVGNPQIADLPALDSLMTREQFIQAAGLDSSKHIIGVFAGSRNREIDDLLPLTLNAMRSILARRKDVQFVISEANSALSKRIHAVIKREKLPPELLACIHYVGEVRKHDLMANADLLWAKSGTTTLESTLFGAPMLIIYRGMWLSFMLFLLFKRVKRVAWPNLLFCGSVVPELFQLDCRAELLVRYSDDLLDVPALRREIRSTLLQLRSQLGSGDYVGNAAEELFNVVGSATRSTEYSQANV